MRGWGTIINVLAVIVGSFIGLILKGGLPKRFSSSVISSVLKICI